MSNIAYVRVSTAEQNEARQIEALKKHTIDKWFTEKVSGKNMNRPQLEAMLDYVREGDTIYIRGAVAGERRSLGIKQRKPWYQHPDRKIDAYHDSRY